MRFHLIVLEHLPFSWFWFAKSLAWNIPWYCLFNRIEFVNKLCFASVIFAVALSKKNRRFLWRTKLGWLICTLSKRCSLNLSYWIEWYLYVYLYVYSLMHKSLRRVSDLDGVSIWGWRRYRYSGGDRKSYGGAPETMLRLEQTNLLHHL